MDWQRFEVWEVVPAEAVMHEDYDRGADQPRSLESMPPAWQIATEG